MATVADTLSAFAARLKFEDLDPAVVHEAKRRIIDSIGCALGAYDEKPASIGRSLASGVSALQGATVLGTTAKSSPEMATFVNGSMVRYLDYNDTYLSLEPAHPSDNLSAALAVAESQGKGGRDLITALVLGYEVQCRLCDRASLRLRGWDHVTYGSLSTALVAGKLLDLTLSEMVHALGLAGVANIALRQTRVGELSMWKGCAFANAARNGVFAALLAKHGLTGPAPLFEGEKGLFRQVTGPFTLPPLGSEFLKILETYIKCYPAEYHAQTAIEAALELKKKIPSPDDIASVNVDTFDACVEIIAGEPEKWKPTTRETADHSLPYCIAAVLLDGGLTVGSFTPERIQDPRIRELMQKIQVNGTAELTALYPEAMPNEIQIRLKSGEILRTRGSYAKGHPKNPMSDGEVEAKFRTLTSSRLPEKRQNQILAQIWELEKASDLSPLLSLCVVN